MLKNRVLTEEEVNDIFNQMLRYGRTSGYVAEVGNRLMFFDSKPNELDSFYIEIEQLIPVLCTDNNSKTYIGIDNGVSGSIGIITQGNAYYYQMPVSDWLSYTKIKRFVTRIDVNKLTSILGKYPNPVVLMERPMVNPARFQASASALRALEATLIVLEMLKIPFSFIDSKEWQKVLLPKKISGNELKIASLQIGCRLFPHLEDTIKRQKDADGLLIAEYCRRTR